MIDITFDRPEGSSAELTLDDGRALIDVIDSRGINGMHAQLATGEWPQEIVVLLRLRGLEYLELRYGNYAITTGRSSNESPDPPLILDVTDENGGRRHTRSPCRRTSSGMSSLRFPCSGSTSIVSDECRAFFIRHSSLHLPCRQSLRERGSMKPPQSRTAAFTSVPSARPNGSWPRNAGNDRRPAAWSCR